ncbi:YihY/virulence factor BrkB family protein [Aquincola sp. S2]|uniref:YihY/virulence factor BrkB family protein n=1 Tax=Pseudaquabacterium terrae TaxID=2732868 RepID=A0ABX2ESF7_9BURK|nr:YihY/virulence factor BrkB family protein [Aquabacterium terrae]NRF71563.1 YihY/virulence factor BrkB family protein [Aquabacterium terrae]
MHHIARHPLRFAAQVLRAFRANQGFLLAGGVAYYALVSIVPMLVLAVSVLSGLLGEAPVFAALERYLAWLLPGQSDAIVAELQTFHAHRGTLGWLLLATMLFFSTLAFTALENAMSIIFRHRVAIRRRHALVSAALPYVYVLCLGIGMLVVTIVATGLQNFGEREWHVLGRALSFGGLSGVMLYLLGLAGEVLVITSIYLVMPVGPLSLRHALLGGLIATLLWELSRHALVWYFETLSQIGRVYGSFTTAIAVLLTLEVAGILLLFGAQVIAEAERIDPDAPALPQAPPKPLRTPG